MITRLLAFIAAALLLGWLLCDIDPDKTYGWLGGIWHGMWFIPNLIRSIFTDALYKANDYTGGYNFLWWVFTVLSCLGIIGGGTGIANRRNDYE